MKQEMFAVYDAAAKMFIDPFCSHTLEMALRGFREVCEKEGHQFARFPEDYALYHVGSWDGEKGEFTPMTANKVAMANQFVLPSPQLGIEEIA